LPTYEYACTACGHRLEAVQSFSDDPLTHCPECEGALRKVYGAVGIVLKGSGFYKTDSRAAASGNGSGAKEAGTSGGDAAADSTPRNDKKDDKDKKESTPAGSDKSGTEAKPAATAAS
jgi:putative FmdB family regulatory protein